jgi:LacI family transcriptional regulator
MVQALAFTRNNASKMIQVEDIAQAAGISRRQLERLFREYIGRTPGAEIQRLRIERAK